MADKKNTIDTEENANDFPAPAGDPIDVSSTKPETPQPPADVDSSVIPNYQPTQSNTSYAAPNASNVTNQNVPPVTVPSAPSALSAFSKAKEKYKNLSSDQMRMIRKVSGWACIIVGIVSLAVCLTMYFSNSFPTWAFDESGSVYTVANLDESHAKIAEAQAVIDNPEASSEDVSAAKRNLGLAKQSEAQIKDHVMWRLLMQFGAFPCIVLFIVWFIFAQKTKKYSTGYDYITTKSIVKKTIAFVIGGFLFFNVLPGVLTDIVANIGTIVGVIILFAIMFLMLKGGDSAGAGSSDGGSGAGAGVGGSAGGFGDGMSDAVAASVAAGSPQGSTFLGTKPTKGEMKEGYSQGGRVAVKEVPANLPLKRVETPFWGRAIAFHGADGQDHYVCTQDEFDKGKTVIMDQKGNKRNA